MFGNILLKNEPWKKLIVGSTFGETELIHKSYASFIVTLMKVMWDIIKLKDLYISIFS